MIVLPSQPSNRYKEYDSDGRLSRWLGGVVWVMVAGILAWLLFGRNPLNSTPPNWGNPPIYPGAQVIATQTWAPGEAGYHLYIRGGIHGGYCEPIKRISIATAAPSDTVLAWYQSHFTAQGWQYDATKLDVGDLMPHYITTGFWHYNWYGNSTFGPAYFMEIESRTTIDILLGQIDQCWKPPNTPTPR